jgi:hypothetical protein
MTYSPRQNRCDVVLALIDECLADFERPTAARINHRPRPRQEELT